MTIAKRYNSLSKMPEGYYIFDQAPEVFSSWYTGPYKDHYEANHARILREKEMSVKLMDGKLDFSAISTSRPMVFYHKKELSRRNYLGVDMKPGEVTYISDFENIPTIQRMPGYPTIEDLQKLADAIGPFKTEKMELVFAECMEMVMHQPMLVTKQDN